MISENTKKTMNTLIRRDITRCYNLIKYRRNILNNCHDDGIDYDCHNLPCNQSIFRTEEDIKNEIRKLYKQLNNEHYGQYILKQI